MTEAAQSRSLSDGHGWLLCGECELESKVDKTLSLKAPSLPYVQKPKAGSCSGSFPLVGKSGL